MALIAPVITEVRSYPGIAHIVSWGPFASSDTFTPFQIAGADGQSVHAFGTFGSGTVTIVGSNEVAATPTSLVGLNNFAGTAISLTAAGLVAIREPTNWIAPVITGAGASAMTVSVFYRG